MSLAELDQVDVFRKTLYENHTAGQDGSAGRGHGYSGGGQGGGGTTSGASLETRNEEISITVTTGQTSGYMFPHGLLELEDVDEDAQDADDTLTNDLWFMDYDDPGLKAKLAKHLHVETAEHEGRLRLRSARVAGMNMWLQATQT